MKDLLPAPNKSKLLGFFLEFTRFDLFSRGARPLGHATRKDSSCVLPRFYSKRYFIGNPVTTFYFMYMTLHIFISLSIMLLLEVRTPEIKKNPERTHTSVFFGEDFF